MRLAFVIAVSLGIPVLPLADERSAADILAAARTLKCRFETAAMGEWDGKSVRSKKSGPPFQEPIHFDSIDPKAGSARMLGNVGAVDVRVLSNSSGLHFVEFTGAGNPVVTTVFASLAAPGVFHAVMSRHMHMLGHPLPSQAYGTCVVL
jgi:hypothetical protein